MSLLHLPKRFFGSLRPRPLDADEAQWVASQLIPGEQALWARMSTADQRHAYGVAQRTLSYLGDNATRPVLAAALLHDIGKVEANVGTLLRVVATFVGGAASREQIASWSRESGWLGRAGTYLRHNEIGEEMLQTAGSDELTSKWAREHELPNSQWTIPEHLSDALYRADNA